jgi:hypothetical protein
MKKLVLITMIICLSSRLLAIEDTLKVNSKIDRVTVFLRGGEEVRKANVELPKGTTRVMFDKLSPYIDINSIQIKSNKDVTILSVVHQFNYFEQLTKSEKIKSLELDQAELSKKIENEQSMLLVYKQEEELILSNKKLSSEQLGVNIEELKKAAEFYRSKLTEIKTNQLEINRRIIKYNNEILKIKSQLAELNVKQTTKTGEIIITIAAKEQMNAELTLSYFIDNCGWVPKYNLRAKNVESPLELNYKAEVYQNTGCDWNNIDMILSTSEPLKSGTKPQLEKWVINSFNSGSGANQSQSKNFTNTSFQLKTKYSIPSNGKNYSADLIDYIIPATYRYSCVPKIEEAAFLMARIANWEQYNLLSGEVNLFFEGTFVGKSLLDVTKPEDTLSFSLGRDKNVIVKREKIDEFNKTQSLGNKKSEMFAWEISLRNNKKQEMEPTIEDQVPVSNSKEIDIKYLDLGGANQEKNTGIIKWVIKIPPSDNKRLSFRYEVKYPEDLGLRL